METILICDDEKPIVTALKIYLSDPEYVLFEASNGQEALKIVENNEIHLVLLDIMMPVMDGITAMSRIREISNMPIILLTAKSEDTDKVLGLNVGADDYMTKPFNPLELTARVRSQLRRYNQLGSAASAASSKLIRCGGLEIDDEAKAVSVDGDPVSLTPLEYGILKLLASNAGRVFSIGEIYEKVWKEEAYSAENTVAVHIRRIREKIEIDPKDPRYLKVVWGVGYKVERQ